MNNCTKCRATLAAGVRFCTQCGTPAPSAPEPESAGTFCPQCGQRVAPGMAFCSGCGTRQGTAPASGTLSSPMANRPVVPSSGSRAPTARSSPHARSVSSVSIRGPVLYVAAAGGMDERALKQSLARASSANRGSLLMVDTSADPVGAVQQILADCRRRRVKLEAVCLLGSDDTLPHHRFEDPCGQDVALPSDSPYGMLRTPSEEERFQGLVLPQIPVCRIPFDDPAKIQPFLAIGADLCESWTDGLAVTAQVWTKASTAVLEAINPTGGVVLHAVPPSGAAQLGSVIKPTTGRCYFNVHGSDQTTSWFGHGPAGQQPEAFEPELVRIAPRGIAVSEACYGAFIDDYGEGISRSFLVAGAGCFVGSTIIAWGLPNGTVGLADKIVMGFYGALDRGMGVARALLWAKEQMLQSYQYPDGSWNLWPNQHNTLLSFIAYGAPCATVRGTRPGRPSRPNLGGGGRDALGRVRARMAGQGDGSSVLEQVMARLESRMGGGAFRILNQGRIDLGAPPPGLPELSQARARIAERLGRPPTHTHVFRSSGGNGETSIFGRSGEGAQARIVCTIVDRSGQIIAEYTAR